MKRRTLIAGIGSLTAASAAVGTGAFTSVSADRSLTVQTAGDANAFLAMEPSTGPNGEYATLSNGVLALDFTETDAGGEGLGTDSVYEFNDVFRVTNRGTQPVYVWATFSGSSGDFDAGDAETDIWLYADGDSTDKLRDSEDDVLYLTVGASAAIGVHVDTDDLNRDQELTATMVANVNDPSPSSVVGGDGTTIRGPTDGLSNYWTLDDAVSGTAIDIAGSGDGTPSGGVTKADGKVGNAASFDGDDDVIETDLNPGGADESLTVAGWLKAPEQSIDQNHFFLSNYVGRRYDGFFAIGTNDGEEMFFWARSDDLSSDKRVGFTNAAFDGAWHHYVGVRDTEADEVRFYVDGSPVGSKGFPGDVPIRNGDTYFGMMQHYRSRNVEGDVDDVRLYGRALSDSEVSSLYDATK